MTDETTNKPLYVSADGTAGPYIMVPVSQLEAVRELLDASEIPYWVDEDAISLDGEPEVSVINLGRDVDPQEVQGILDGAV